MATFTKELINYKYFYSFLKKHNLTLTIGVDSNNKILAIVPNSIILNYKDMYGLKEETKEIKAEAKGETPNKAIKNLIKVFDIGNESFIEENQRKIQIGKDSNYIDIPTFVDYVPTIV